MSSVWRLNNKVTGALGKGSFGVVWGGESSTQGEVAIKSIPCWQRGAVADAEVEGELLRSLGKNASEEVLCRLPALIAQETESLPNSWRVWIVMTRMPGEQLSRFTIWLMNIFGVMLEVAEVLLVVDDLMHWTLQPRPCPDHRDLFDPPIPLFLEQFCCWLFSCRSPQVSSISASLVARTSTNRESYVLVSGFDWNATVF